MNKYVKTTKVPVPLVPTPDKPLEQLRETARQQLQEMIRVNTPRSLFVKVTHEGVTYQGEIFPIETKEED